MNRPVDRFTRVLTRHNAPQMRSDRWAPFLTWIERHRLVVLMLALIMVMLCTVTVAELVYAPSIRFGVQ